jgi:ketosteroid isomerase-like protein
MAEESTTSDLVAIARRGNEAASRRDIDGMMSIWGSEPVWDLSPMGLGAYEGVAAIRGFFEDWLGSYDEFEMAEEELVDLGGGVTFGVFVQRGRPTGSSGEVTIRYGSVGVWDAGNLVRVTQYSDIAEARTAAERLAEERG